MNETVSLNTYVVVFACLQLYVYKLFNLEALKSKGYTNELINVPKHPSIHNLYTYTLCWCCVVVSVLFSLVLKLCFVDVLLVSLVWVHTLLNSL